MTTCESCGAPLEQPATGRRRKFCSSACRQRHHREFRYGRRGPELSLWNWLAEEIELAVMHSAARSFGGHRSGEGTSIAENCRNSQELDTRLSALLGGIPQPRRRGTVIELPVREHREVEAAVAA
jgi:hypothetical protein